MNITHSTKFTKKIKVSICSRYFDNFLPLVQSIQQKKFVRRFGQWTNCWRLELWPSNPTSFIRSNDGLFKCIFCHNGARVVGVLAHDPIGFRAGQNNSKPDNKSRLLTRLLPSITTCWLDYLNISLFISAKAWTQISSFRDTSSLPWYHLWWKRHRSHMNIVLHQILQPTHGVTR